MEIQNIIDLMSTITSKNYSGETFNDSNLKRVRDINISGHSNEYKNQSLRFLYVNKLIELLSSLKECMLKHSDDSTDIILSSIHCAIVSRSIHSVVTYGFIPCLIPSIWKSFENNQKYEQLTEKIAPNSTYEELKFNVNSFFDLIKEPTLKRLILVKHTNVLLAGICQLCLLPIAKPGSEIATESAIDQLKYEQLINEQKTFKNILKNLILIERDPLFIREIIFVLGHKFNDLILKTQEKIRRIYNICSKQPVGNQRTIDDVLFDTRDPLLPCRSHALMELKKLIESGDKMVLVKKTEILIVIQENLKNTDSYLYLSAIFTLSSLCSYYPNDILPILCEEYSMPINYNHSPETRLKIGEVLMKTIKSLNETIPLYKNRLLNTFMAGVRDNDHLVRASSLSNLADVCRLLRYNLGSIVAEIVNCADYVLRFDPAIEPRRAAVLLLQMIIQGGDSELLEEEVFE
ncbi:PREDICTED: uncharacterized protein LOC107169075 [Diuraphis noxia]|uniref:uncharacterized protein LOC107169075 n=1 Tax=Diuraphis noxia TaxID=143948 RepID=UPI0007639EF9|nr:PREDICTED: uncharacterized protein LOC107169075 [Diuraphis noxia]